MKEMLETLGGFMQEKLDSVNMKLNECGDVILRKIIQLRRFL